MKLLFAILAVVIVFASFYADYKWRQWMTVRKPQPPRRDDPPVVADPSRRHDRDGNNSSSRSAVVPPADTNGYSGSPIGVERSRNP